MNYQGMIKRDFAWPLQQSILTVLNAASIVKIGSPALAVPISDFGGVEKGTAYPYITIGDMTETLNDTKNTSGQEMTFNVHVWSGYKGMQEVTFIANQVLQALTGNPIDMSTFGFQMIQLKKDAQIPNNVQGLYTHLVIRFRALIEDISTVQPVG